MGYSGVYYQVVDKNNNLILNFSTRSAICFRDYSSLSGTESRWTGKNTVKIWIPKDKSPFDEAQIKLHLESLQNLFPTSFDQDEKTFFVILKESEYKNLTHIRTALDFIRLLWESNAYKVFEYYLKTFRDQKNLDYLVLMQVIFIWLSAQDIYNTLHGHLLPSSYSGFVLSSKQFLEELERSVSAVGGSTVLWRAAKNNKHHNTYGWSTAQHLLKIREEIKKLALVNEEDVEKIINLVNK